jgi:predicted aspartyl protease
MEIATMGRVVVSVKIENLDDLHEVKAGVRSSDKVRQVEFSDALVDTGATMLSLPKRLIAELGLQPDPVKSARTPAGLLTFNVYPLVRLTVQGRYCHPEVCEISDDCPVLIWQIPLEMLDFVVDPAGQRLIGNPEHGGEQMIELYWTQHD